MPGARLSGCDTLIFVGEFHMWATNPRGTTAHFCSELLRIFQHARTADFAVLYVIAFQVRTMLGYMCPTCHPDIGHATVKLNYETMTELS